VRVGAGQRPRSRNPARLQASALTSSPGWGINSGAGLGVKPQAARP
jgi:hypothetical protein